MKAPSDCHTMPELRAAIDMLDSRIVELIKQRADYIDRAVTIKQAEGLPARIDSRVEDVVAKVRARAMAEGLDPVLAETIWRQLIEWSIAREEKALGA